MNFVSGSTVEPGNLFAGTSTYNFTFGGNTIASGTLVVLNVGTTIRTVSSISGTNLTMALAVQSSSNGAQMIESQWWGITTGTVTSVTITLSGNTADDACVGYVELSGQSADQSGLTTNSSANDNVTAHNSGSVTPPTAVNAVVAGMFRTSATWTEDGGFTLVSGANANCLMGYLLQSAATAQEYNGTSDINRYSAVVIGAYAGTAAASAANAKLVKTWRQ